MEISEALAERKWKTAAELINEALAKSGGTAEQRAEWAYNLVVSYINLQDPMHSQAALNAHSALLSEQDRETLQKEIYAIPTSIKKNELKGVAWFQSDTKLSDVMGMEKVKQTIREKIINPIKNQELYSEYGLTKGDSFILYGPPGTGKTYLARAIAGETGIRMLLANVHELVSKYQGESAKNLHLLFEQARTGGPAIIFFDEIDSLAQSRNSSNVSSTGGEDRRIIDTLLVELDGAQKSNSAIYLIGATNRPWDMDSAFTRSGRFNTLIYVPPPTYAERKHLFKFYIRKLKAQKNINYRKLALLSFGMTPADISSICESSAKHAINAMRPDKHRPLNTADFLWGVKQKNANALFKEYESALERMREMPEAEKEGYKDLRKDILFYHFKGRTRVILNKLLSLLMLV